jgi:hypothetical protein
MDKLKMLAIALASMTPPEREAAELMILTNTIGQIESGGNYKAVGDRGAALGAWQMHIAAWIMANQWREAHGLSKIKRSLWQVPDNQRAIAFAYVNWCRERLLADGIKHPSPEQIYLAFAMGPTAFADIAHSLVRAPDKKRDAAERVAEVYNSLVK